MTDALSPRSRLALLLGPAVVLAGLSLRWYAPTAASIPTVDTFSGWEALEVIDVLLVFVAVAVWMVLLADARRARLPRELVRAVDALAILAFVCVVYRIVSPPDDLVPRFVTEADPSAGPFVSAAGLALVLWGLRPSAASS